MKLRGRTTVASLALLALAGLAPGAFAAAPTGEPGATLVFPYFEVDLDAPDGLTTLLSVNNARRSAVNGNVLAHAVLWSDWGVPVYSWDLYLAPGDVVSYNLRDLVAYGNLPATTPPAGLGAHCAASLAPRLEGEALAALQRQLTGRPDPVTALCSSEPRPDATIASGSITIDVVRDCAHDGIDDPFDPGYFSGSPALADSVERLLGDFILVDPAADLAEGYSGFPLRRSAVPAGDSFWEGLERTDLRRETLSTRWRLRFLEGGPFAARTSLFVYHRRGVPVSPATCVEEAPGQTPRSIWSFDVHDPSGLRVVEDLRVPDQGRRTAARVELDLPAGVLSGTIHFRAFYLRGLGVPEIVDGQSLLFGSIEARGRFGVGIFGTPLD